MKNIEDLVATIYSYHLVALKSDRLTNENVEASLMLSAGFTVASPLLFLLMIILVILIPIFGFDSIQLPFFVTILVIIFGVARVTDKIYLRNVLGIERVAAEILVNPVQGVSWARRRLFAIYAVQLVITVVVGVLAHTIFSG